MTDEAATAGLPRATRRWGVLWLLVLLAAGVAAWFAWQATGTPVGPDTVSEVLVKIKPGPSGVQAETKQNWLGFDTPDLYLKLTLADGGVLETAAFDDTPVGSGLLFELDESLPLAAVEEVQVWDADTVGDDLVDRVRRDVDDDPRVIEGNQFRVVLRGRVAKPATWAMPSLIAAAAVGLLALAKLVWDQVV